MVAEVDASGAEPKLKTLYIRSNDELIGLMRPLVAAPTLTSVDWQSRFYHAEYIGSVRRLTNEDGAITDGYTYSAFGELLAHTGTDPQPYAFTGEPLDPNSGWQYHRARWMDPRVGRFASADPWRGEAFDPPTLHQYLNAANDPARRADPSGLMTLVAFTAVAAIIRVIAGSLAYSALHSWLTGGSTEVIVFQGTLSSGTAQSIAQRVVDALGKRGRRKFYTLSTSESAS